MSDHNTSEPTLPQLQRLRDARRVLEINLEGHPFLDAEARATIRQGKRAAWAVLAEVAEELVATLDTAAGDPDFEDGTDLEDEGLTPRAEAYVADRPACPVSDGGDLAWIERVDQSTKPLPNEAWADVRNSEDDEEDDPQGEITDDDPAFDKRSRKLVNGRWSGPGCPVSDPGGGNITDEPHDFDTDAELETWAHADDHPAELFKGRRPEPPEAA